MPRCPGRGSRGLPRSAGKAWRDAFLLLVLPLLLGGGLTLALPSATGSGLPVFQVSLTATPSYGMIPLLVSFNATVVSGVPTSYDWCFGDGSCVNVARSATSDEIAHNYTRVGTFTATVTVYEGSSSAGQSISVHVGSAPLLVQASVSPASGTAPLKVTFQGSVQGGTGTYVAFSWDFGSSSVGTGSGLSVSCTYPAAGDYHVSFTATDSAGASASTWVWVNVTAGPAVPPGPSPGASSDPWLLLVIGALGFVAGGLAALLASGPRRRRDRSTATGPDHTEVGAPTPGLPAEPSPAPTPAPATPHPPTKVPPLAPVPPETGPARASAGSPGEVGVEDGSAEGGTAPEQVASSPQPRAPPKVDRAALRVSERVVVHLASQGALHPDDTAPVELTQQGMAASLGIRQNALTNVLRRLEAAGVLSAEVRHVRGRPRRMKVYLLTGRGETLGRELRHQVAAGKPSAGRRSAPGTEAEEAPDTWAREPQ